MIDTLRMFLERLLGIDEQVHILADLPQAHTAPATPAGPSATAVPAVRSLTPMPHAAGTAQEADVRVQIVSSILATPHGKRAELAPLHQEALQRDPLFYGHFAVWYMGRGEVRDHKVLFVAHLLTSDFAALREAGWVMLQGLPPHMVAATVDHAKVQIGKLPRSFKGAVAAYLRALEADEARFDRAALRSRRELKHLYATLRLAPGARAQQTLFDEQPPAGSPLHGLKLLAQAGDPAAQAQVIVADRIPYTLAVGAVRAVTPSVLAALVSVMTPQETINHLAALKRRGAFDSPEVKAMVEAKIAAAETDRRVSSLKATQALKRVELDADTAALLTDVTDRRVAAIERISRATALLVDKSGSMTQAIDVAKEVAALVSAACDDFRVLAFDTAAFDITAAGPQRSAWEQAFAMVRADGGTSVGAPLAKLTRERHYVEQIIVITDAGENTGPLFHNAYAEYARIMGVSPQVVIVGVGTLDRTALRRWEASGIPTTLWEFKGDYYSLPNLLPLLNAPSRAELVDRMMAIPLPTRG